MATTHTNFSHEYNHLDVRQREAVCADVQPLWVNAGPGAGKTKVIVERIKYLILAKHIPINNIIALTFTNKAAEEMQDRIMQLLKEYNNRHSNNNRNRGIYDKIRCQTFHAFCMKILKEYGQYIGLNRQWTVEPNPLRIIKDILKQNTEIITFIQSQNINSDKIPTNRILTIIATAKRHIQTAKTFKEKVNKKDYIQIKNTNANSDMMKLYKLSAEVYIKYEKELQTQNKLDFNDLLFKTMQLFVTHKKTQILDILCSQNRYSHIVIDEFQDTNCIQFLIAKTLVLHRYKLFKDFKSIMVVGDADQTIFSWRGSQDFQQTFKNTFPNYKTINLIHNYRSTKNILSIANEIINKSSDTKRINKRMKTDKDNGQRVIFEECVSDADEAYFVIDKISEIYTQFMKENKNKNKKKLFDLENIAILYRSSVQTRIIEEKLTQSRLRYTIAGGSAFYQRKEIMEIIYFLRILNNRKDNHSLLQIMRSSLAVFSGIGNAMIQKIVAFGKGKTPILSLQESLFRIKQIDKISDKKEQKIIAFLKSIVKLRKIRNNPLGNITDLTEAVLKEMNYKTHIYSIIKDKNAADDKWANVREFIKICNEFDALSDQSTENNNKLSDFLASVALNQISTENSAVNRSDHSCHPLANVKGSIHLSTIHKSKGLEWANVFVIGCSRGQLPHFRAIQSNDIKHIEEERRLAFVAVTRAQKRLFLSYAMYRNDYSKNSNNNRRMRTEMSRFFVELSEESIAYVRYYTNGNEGNKNKNKKRRKNVFKKQSSKSKKNKNKNENNNNGFQNTNDIESGKGTKMRQERKRIVAEFGMGFQKASALNNDVSNGKCGKKRKFKIPRMAKKENSLCKEFETVNINDENINKTNRNRGKKRALNEMGMEYKTENKIYKPAKKKRKKTKKNQVTPRQKLILSFLTKK